ncbi:hypothetical protein [Bacillus subtilis]|uniref:hypothetical protein n=1 Tax=Bacillus subtilis TaxID=1423 RepID=UPI00129DAD95|nr:hypothetical protein [Bacillus subtilis]NRF03066.1 hypothetical protein [Bacillus subtilis]NRG37224.1 hypothetical protein [Bacillus subtilis]QGI31274.1 hypothetical protein GII85_11750 [Bacillus subtilis]WHX51930.1 hypothetical protein QNH30_11860 [Bacillus subtilis]WHX55931.1 hypothetical protein QNK02_11860 [Bacillus subtilis]
MKKIQNWEKGTPAEVWYLLEDWGYFRSDINLTDAVNVAKYILNSLITIDPTDYYYSLKELDSTQYHNMMRDCLNFIHKYQSMTTIQLGKLAE